MEGKEREKFGMGLGRGGSMALALVASLVSRGRTKASGAGRTPCSTYTRQDVGATGTAVRHLTRDAGVMLGALRTIAPLEKR